MCAYCNLHYVEYTPVKKEIMSLLKILSFVTLEKGDDNNLKCNISALSMNL